MLLDQAIHRVLEDQPVLAPLVYARLLRRFAPHKCQQDFDSIEQIIASATPILLPKAAEHEMLAMLFSAKPLAPPRIRSRILLPWLRRLALSYPGDIATLGPWPDEQVLLEPDVRWLVFSGVLRGRQLVQLTCVARCDTPLLKALAHCSATVLPGEPGESLPLALFLLDPPDLPRFLELWPIGQSKVLDPAAASLLRKHLPAVATRVTALPAPPTLAPAAPSAPVSFGRGAADLSDAFRRWLQHATTEPLLRPLWSRLPKETFAAPPTGSFVHSQEAVLFYLQENPPPVEAKAYRLVIEAIFALFPSGGCLPLKSLCKLIRRIDSHPMLANLAPICLEACHAATPMRRLAVREQLAVLLDCRSHPRWSFFLCRAIRKAIAHLS